MRAIGTCFPCEILHNLAYHAYAACCFLSSISPHEVFLRTIRSINACKQTQLTNPILVVDFTRNKSDSNLLGCKVVQSETLPALHSHTFPTRYIIMIDPHQQVTRLPEKIVLKISING